MQDGEGLPASNGEVDDSEEEGAEMVVQSDVVARKRPKGKSKASWRKAKASVGRNLELEGKLHA